MRRWGGGLLLPACMPATGPCDLRGFQPEGLPPCLSMYVQCVVCCVPPVSGCSAGDTVFQLGAPADEVYIVERGQGESVELVGVGEVGDAGMLASCQKDVWPGYSIWPPIQDFCLSHCLLASVVCRIDFNAGTVHSRSQLPAVPPDARPAAAERAFKYGPGGLFGELDFFLQRPRR